MPPPQAPVDPNDDRMREAVQSFLIHTKAPVSSRYEFQRVDLDADGLRDALVLLKTPYGYWCGMHGCALLVFKAGDDKFTLVNAVQPIREPLYISDRKTNGWKDLIVRVSGRWDRAKNVALKFNGYQYPNDPSNLPSDLRFAYYDNARVFYD